MKNTIEKHYPRHGPTALSLVGNFKRSYYIASLLCFGLATAAAADGYMNKFVAVRRFKIQRNTLSRRHWNPELQVDPNFPDNISLEWIATLC